MIDSSWDAPERPAKRPVTPMTTIDSSWSEPQGLPVVAPMALAVGTAAHSTSGFDGGEPAPAAADRQTPRFLGIPVRTTGAVARTAVAAGAPAGRPDHDATYVVNPLPAPPPRARANGTGESSRIAVLADEPARTRHQRTAARRRRRIAVVAGGIAGIALACGALVLSRELDRPAAPPAVVTQHVVMPATPPAAVPAPAASVKMKHASAAAPKKVAAAPVPAPAPASAPAPAAKPAPAAAPVIAKQPAPAPAAKPAPAIAAKPAPAIAAKPAPAKLPPGKTVALAPRPPGKPAAPAAKKPAPVKPAAR